MRILIAGASGVIGSSLVSFLQKEGHLVEVLQRISPSCKGIFWDPEKGLLSSDQLEGFDAIINLSGASLNQRRWTKKQMAYIRESRLLPTKLLVEAIGKLKVPPKVFLSASAVGYYGDQKDRVVDEENKSGTDFLALLCREWEEEAKKVQDYGVRAVLLRMGIVLTPQGGALASLLPIFRLGLGGTLASGKQWMSWIAMADLLSLIDFLIQTPSLSGPINAVAPYPITNKIFTKKLAEAVHRPAWFSVPRLLLRLLLGKIADAAILTSIRAYPAKALHAGFSFSLPELEFKKIL